LKRLFRLQQPSNEARAKLYAAAQF
jgi:hypothetical protein